MNKKILLVGGGGHCRSVIDSLLELRQFSELGIIDKIEKKGKQVLGIQFIGCDEDLPQLFNAGYKSVVLETPILGLSSYHSLMR